MNKNHTEVGKLMKITEETLKNWCVPASDTEDEKINNAISMIKDAVKSTDLDGLIIEVFVQGSYANNTNVRTSSDVDVCIMLKNTFYTEYPHGLSNKDYGFINGTISFEEYKNSVVKALISKFGSESISVGNKSVKIKSNTYHVEADAVIAFMLKNFNIIHSKDPNRYVEGTRFIAKDCSIVTNYPKDHINNGIAKNNHTNRDYKKLVRIFKKIRDLMVDDGEIDENKITSFLVECLVWNIPDFTITGFLTWTETVKAAIIYVYNAINDKKHIEWREVSEHLYLFKDRKWTDEDAKDFMYRAWNYLGYADESN